MKRGEKERERGKERERRGERERERERGEREERERGGGGERGGGERLFESNIEHTSFCDCTFQTWSQKILKLFRLATS